MFRIGFFAIAVIVALPGSAFAQNVQMPPFPSRNIKADPDSVSAIVRAAGYKAKVGAYANGDPYIEAEGNGIPFTIFLNNCDQQNVCRTVQFYAGFSMQKPVAMSVINDWNRQTRFAKAYIDDQNDPRLEMDVNLSGSGIAADNFADDLRLWVQLLSAFKTHIGWTADSRSN